MPRDLLIRGAHVVLANGILPDASVRIANGVIVDVSASIGVAGRSERVIEADGRWLLPGLVDMHCDAIEREVQPRPGVQLPFEMALREIDRKLAMVGITTMYHSVSFGAGEGVRSNEVAAALIRAITEFGEGPSLVRHQAHLRFEISNWEAIDLVATLVSEGSVGLLSLMDHTPGQGQYRDPTRYRDYVKKTFWIGEAEVDRIVREKHEGRARVTEAHLRELGEIARSARVPVAGHDPDSSESVQIAAARGASMLEFPMSLPVARYATEAGLDVCVGAPNVLYGRSHDGNLSAREAIAANAANVLCSDYYPSGLLPAVWTLVEQGIKSLPTAVAMASLHPARAIGLGFVAGSIEPGWLADLLLVSERGGRPVVDSTIVGGEVVMTADARSVPDRRVAGEAVTVLSGR